MRTVTFQSRALPSGKAGRPTPVISCLARSTSPTQCLHQLLVAQLLRAPAFFCGFFCGSCGSLCFCSLYLIHCHCSRRE